MNARPGSSRPHTFSRWLTQLVLRRRAAILLLYVTITAWACLSATRLKFEESLDGWFLQNTEELEIYQRFRRQFGSDEFVVVGLYPDEVFAEEFLAQLREFTHRAESLPLTKRVLSLTNAKVLQRQRKQLQLVPFVEGSDSHWPSTPAELEKLRLRATQAPTTVGRLLDRAGTATAVMVELSPEATRVAEESQVVAQLRQLCQTTFAPSVTCRLAGTPVLDDAILRFSRRDLVVLAPMAVVACALTCFLLFRSLWATLAATLVPLIAAIWVLGFMGYFQMPISFLTSALLMVIMVSGITDAIHLLTCYLANLHVGRSRATALRQTLSQLWSPCALTTATTAAGFLSLVTCDIVPVRQFGLLAAIGAVSALATSLLLMPSVMLFSARAARRSETLPVQRLTAWISRLSTPNRKQRGIALAVALMVAGPCLVAVPSLQVAASPLSLFRPDQAVRQDAEQIDRSFGGFATLEFQFTSSESVLHWEQLQKIGKFTRWLTEQKIASDTLSFLDLLTESNRVLPYQRNRQGRPRGMWNTLREAQRLEPALYSRLLQEDDTVARISARVPLTASHVNASYIEWIDQHLAENFADSSLTAISTGYVKLFSNLRSNLVDSQIHSLCLAAVSITLVLGLALRSWSMALLSLVLNFVPVVCGFGIMAACDIPLDPGTIMIATVAMGIVVDDTCHLLCAMRDHRQLGRGLKESLRLTVRTTGPAICVTSFVLVLGFSTLMLGSFAPSNYFGFVMVFIVTTALLVDLVLVPTVILSLRPALRRLTARESFARPQLDRLAS